MPNPHGGRHSWSTDDDRYRARERDDDDRFERGSSWDDRDRGYSGSTASRWGSSWSNDRRGTWQGYGYSDGDRPSFERGASREGVYGGSGYEPGYAVRGLGHRGKGPQGFQRSDERVRELVCEALTDDDDVDATHIEVNVKNAEVMLSGVVEDREMKRRAERCVERVPGVRDVHNQLRIGRG
jgi:osmotically-inducible protein OsmY